VPAAVSEKETGTAEPATIASDAVVVSEILGLKVDPATAIVSDDETTSANAGLKVEFPTLNWSVPVAVSLNETLYTTKVVLVI
jgi:hypothetical protein